MRFWGIFNSFPHPDVLLFLSWCFVEIEAKEACTWLRAAGFPQYAQLYEGKERFKTHQHVHNMLVFWRLLPVGLMDL